jgi:hypothetical protein
MIIRILAYCTTLTRSVQHATLPINSTSSTDSSKIFLFSPASTSSIQPIFPTEHIFHYWPYHRSCHSLSRRMQAFCAITLPCSRERHKSSPFPLAKAPRTWCYHPFPPTVRVENVSSYSFTPPYISMVWSIPLFLLSVLSSSLWTHHVLGFTYGRAI